MNVYQCKLCGELVMSQGLVLHMIGKHKLYPEFYEPNDITAYEQRYREPDLIIKYPNIPRGKAGYCWRHGQTVAKWVFQLKGQFYLTFKKGDLRVYKFWRPSRVRYLREKYGRGHLDISYITDYPELFQEAQV